MSSDAKIGLLLGLIFIFVIAFIINGIPGIQTNRNDNNLTTEMMNFNGTPGLASNERKAQEALLWEQTGSNNEFVQSNNNDVDNFRSAWQDDGDVRSEMPMPGQDQSINHGQPTAEGSGYSQTSHTGSNSSDSTSGIADGSAGTYSQSADTTITDQIKDFAAKAIKTIQPPSQNGKKSGRKSSQKVKAIYYVVKKSDHHLTGIAKKFYGPKQGNKLANIEKIFKANRDVLKSINDLKVGQKIKIPVIPSMDIDRLSKTVFSSRKFEHVKSVGAKHLRKSGRKRKKTRWYTVKQDDSLWKIAAKQLGNGTRYKEILKLNRGRIQDEDNLEVGTKLVLPAKK